LELQEDIVERIVFKQFFIDDIKSVNNQLKDPIVLDHLYDGLNKKGFSDRANPHRIQKNWDINTEHGKFNFDFAWKNGVWNLVKPVNFDLSTSDRIISKARNNLGEFIDLNRQIDKTEFKGNILVGKPKNKSFYPAYDKAIEILEQSDTRIIEESNKQEYSKYQEEILEAVSM
jgi:hypothetical protein